MDRFDQRIKGLVKENLEHVRLSEDKKIEMGVLLKSDFHRQRRRWWEKAVWRIIEFWNTTYEINITPLAAAVVVVMVLGVFTIREEVKLLPDREIVYVQQIISLPDGSINISFVPSKGGLSDAGSKD